MLTITRHKAASLALSLAGLATPSLATGLPGGPSLSGAEELSCAAILCLSSSAGKGVTECQPSLSHYFGIKHRYLSDTLEARLNFLNLCPTGLASGMMSSLTSALSRGAGRCDAQELNAYSYELEAYPDHTFVRQIIPDYCVALYGHDWTDLRADAPVYIGEEEFSGRWASRAHTAKEQNAYDRRKAEILRIRLEREGNRDMGS